VPLCLLVDLACQLRQLMVGFAFFVEGLLQQIGNLLLA